MKVLNCELEDLDTLDPDVLEKIENARDKFMEECTKAENEARYSFAVRRQCAAVAEFIETLWGKGAAEKVFGKKTNLLQCLKAFEEIRVGLDEDTERQTKEMDNIASKYSPMRVVR